MDGDSTNRVGEEAATLNDGDSTNRVGEEAATLNDGDSTNRVGEEAATLNDGVSTNRVGEEAATLNDGDSTNRVGEEAATLNDGDSTNRVGEEAATLNDGHDGPMIVDGDGVFTDEKDNWSNSAGDDGYSSEEFDEEVDRKDPPVRVLSSNGLRLTVPIKLDSSVENLKSVIAWMVGWPVWEQRLIFKGRLMKNDQTLETYGIKHYQTIQLVTRLDPGRKPSYPCTRDRKSTSTEAGSNVERHDAEPAGRPELEKTQAAKKSMKKRSTPNTDPLPNPWACTRSRFF